MSPSPLVVVVEPVAQRLELGHRQPPDLPRADVQDVREQAEIGDTALL